MEASPVPFVFSCTSGHCHICGDNLCFRKRGLKNRKNENGALTCEEKN
jgi:hypothetical protein